MGERVIGIDLQRLLEEAHRAIEIVGGPLVPEVTATQVQVMCLGAFGRSLHKREAR